MTHPSRHNPPFNAVHFGAGNIGRGFLGQLLYEGGYRTTFVDADPQLVSALEGRRSYPLRLVDADHSRDLVIGNLSAIHSPEFNRIVAAIVDADLVSTAVGVSALPQIAPIIAQGIAARASAGKRSLNILLCENQWHVGAAMQEMVARHLPSGLEDYLRNQIGFVETVIGRMVPVPTSSLRDEDALLIAAEPYKELPISKESLRAPAPDLPGLLAADDFDAYEARKLLLHNMSHAALAYLGYRRGYEFIWQCVEDAVIGAVCLRACHDVSSALSAEYTFPLTELSAFVDDLLVRFANRALGDTVARVAADPLRKLRPDDRLIKAALLCQKHGIEPTALCEIIQAAVSYDNLEDLSAQRLQEIRRLHGDSYVLEVVCGLPPSSVISDLILRGN